MELVITAGWVDHLRPSLSKFIQFLFLDGIGKYFIMELTQWIGSRILFLPYLTLNTDTVIFTS